MNDLDDFRVRRLTGVSGRVWVVDEREEAERSSRGQTTHFYGWPEGHCDQRHWVQRAVGGSEVWKAAREHLCRAYEIGRKPEVASSTFIHAPVDLIEASNVYLMSELAETDLSRELRDGPLGKKGAVLLEQRLRAALRE